MQTGARAQIGNRRRRIVRRSVANVADANPNAIARQTVNSDAHKHVANVTQIVVQADDDRKHPRVSWRNTKDNQRAPELKETIITSPQSHPRQLRRGAQTNIPHSTMPNLSMFNL